MTEEEERERYRYLELKRRRAMPAAAPEAAEPKARSALGAKLRQRAAAEMAADRTQQAQNMGLGDQLLSGAGAGFLDAADSARDFVGKIPGLGRIRPDEAAWKERQAEAAPLTENTPGGAVGHFVGQTAPSVVAGLGAGGATAGLLARAAPLAAGLPGMAAGLSPGVPWLTAAVEGLGQGTMLGSPGQDSSLLSSLLNVGLHGGGQALRAAPEATGWLGNQAQNAAGWLKTHSLKPTPLLAESIEEIPGGAPALGRRFLERGVGGVTKRGTAQQADVAKGEAGQAIDALAAEHDAAGKSPISMDSALAAASAEAQRLSSRPTTKAVGQRLKGLIDEYAAIYQGKPTTAEGGLALKRELADEVYGVAEEYARTSAKELKPYKKGVSLLERGVNRALDDGLGPEFAKRNLAYRQLGAGTQAAERNAARADSNNIFSLLATMGGLGHYGVTHDPITSAAVAAGTKALGAWGPQVGARGLYGLGSALQAAPAVGSAMAGAMPQAVEPLTRASLLAKLLHEMEPAK